MVFRIAVPFRKRPFVAAALAIAATVGVYAFADYYRAYPVDVAVGYVGRDQCRVCHEPQMESFAGSHHDKAMDVACEESVRGDFNDATLEHDGMVSRFFRDGEKFMVHTDGPDGTMQDFEVGYVFGYEPLQQYMVEFDRQPDTPPDAIGRLQVLRLCWDTEAERWFYLRPPDVDDKLLADDPLHWTGIAQRWQSMCAECHSTDLHKNFDPATGRYHTTFAEMDVSCEACHGPASLHVEMANSGALFWDRRHGKGLAKLKSKDATAQLEACAPCHSRRGELSDDFRPGLEYCNHFQLETMREDTYHADGQIKDEVYVFGSFVQSKMYHKGIRCTDCHDPHTAKLIHQGNQVCTSCHQHSAGKYDVPSHHHHAVGSAGAQCVNCHMPHTTYMEVDDRRDHSLRVPRPDVSARTGTPNACTQCHFKDRLPQTTIAVQKAVADLDYAATLALARQGGEQSEIAQWLEETDRWCNEACEQWYGESRKTPKLYGEDLAALRNGDTDATKRLIGWLKDNSEPTSELPNLARASILDELATTQQTDARITSIALDQLHHRDPIVRAAAINLVASTGAPQTVSQLLSRLQDHSTLVRIASARQLMAMGVYSRLENNERRKLDNVLDQDVHASIEQNNDRAGSHLQWGSYAEARGRTSEAIQAYKTAIRIEPNMAGGRTNLALLLDRIAASMPADQQPELRSKIKQLRKDELRLLARDAKLAPEQAAIAYRFGWALYLDGQKSAALAQLQRAAELEPENPIFLDHARQLREDLNTSSE